MKNLNILLLIIIIISCNKNIENNNVINSEKIIIFNETEYNNYKDYGVIINTLDNSELEGYNLHGIKSIVEKIFVNNYSGEIIYYIGAEYRGEAVFWIFENGYKKIILETHIQYGPLIIWHGNNIAEIFIQTGSPFRHSYYFNFVYNRISDKYYFPMYLDTENLTVLIWGDIDIELYDLNNNELIQQYSFRRNEFMTAA